jgi:putative phosphoesterase
MTVRIVVLADTHMPRRGRQLPREVFSALERADMIVHLGDFTGLSVVEMLENYGALYAVHGNNDDEDVQALFPPARLLAVEGHSLILLHGDIGGRTALTVARSVTDAEIVLFGHSHQPYCKRENGRLLFNPGSPTERRWSPHRSFGVLEVGETVHASIIRLPG